MHDHWLSSMSQHKTPPLVTRELLKPSVPAKSTCLAAAVAKSAAKPPTKHTPTQPAKPPPSYVVAEHKAARIFGDKWREVEAEEIASSEPEQEEPKSKKKKKNRKRPGRKENPNKKRRKKKKRKDKKRKEEKDAKELEHAQLADEGYIPPPYGKPPSSSTQPAASSSAQPAASSSAQQPASPRLSCV